MVSLGVSSCGVVPMPQLPGMSGASSEPQPTAQTPEDRARALMARGAATCKEMITAAAKDSDPVKRNQPFTVSGEKYYLHEPPERADGSRSGGGVVLLNPKTLAGAQHYPGNQLVLVCWVQSIDTNMRLLLAYTFEDLPHELQGGLVSGSLTNGEVETALLNLPDAKRFNVSQFVDRQDHLQVSVVGLQPTDSGMSAVRFGIRTGGEGGRLWDTRLIVPADDDFVMALDRAEGTDAQVQEVAGRFR